MTMFKPATKKQAKLRMALIGPSGSGKTYSALAVAAGIGGKVAVIDTERGSASKYADLFHFDVLELDAFDPQLYINAIRDAAASGYSVLIIDSLSHAWMGAGGILEKVDNAAKRSKSGNSFTAWRDVTPIHNALVDNILQANLHIIATMRAKTEYVMEANDKGKLEPRKVGLAPVQRDGLEYEFDVIGDMDLDNNLVVTKSRCPALTNAVINKPGQNLAEVLNAWLGDGSEPVVYEPPPVAPADRPALVKAVAAWIGKDEATARRALEVRTTEGILNASMTDDEVMATLKARAESSKSATNGNGNGHSAPANAELPADGDPFKARAAAITDPFELAEFISNRVPGNMAGEVSAKQKQLIAMLITEALPEPRDIYDPDNVRHIITKFLFEQDGVSALSKAQASAMLDWLAGPDGKLHPCVSEEIAMIVEFMAEHEQTLEGEIIE